MVRKVLIIDDEVDLTFMVKAYLEFSKEYLVEAANSGKDGLKAADRFKPDIILLDIMMPHMDGFEVLKRLKASLKTLNIPVIMLTAKGDDESKMKASALYDEDYIVKPAEMEYLKAKIEEVISRRHSSG